jgi:hypothetical protein
VDPGQWRAKIKSGQKTSGDVRIDIEHFLQCS